MEIGMKSTQKKSDFQVPNLERAILILEYLLDFPDGKGISDLAKELEFPKNSVYRILNTLEAHDYIIRDQFKKYTLSNKMLSMSYQSQDRKNLIECAAEHMRNLRDSVKETVVISIVSGNEGVVIDQVPGVHHFRFVVERGTKQELHTSASIKSILAFEDEDKVKEMIDKMNFTKRTKQTITTAAGYLKELKLVKQRGYAIDQGEALEGVCCIAAPIFDHQKTPIAAITVTGPSSRMPESDIEEIAVKVMEAASEISLKLS